jgi:alkyl hydroperoxide reductase subunit AhpC
VAVYQKYHSKGFDIIGVSLDKDKAAWKSAILQDNLTWTHVSDLKYFNNEAAKLYAISSIPANFLLNEQGIIVAVNLRGDALGKKVKELLRSK